MLPHAYFWALLVLPCARILLLISWYAGARRMMNTQHWSRVGKFRVAAALVCGWWSCEDRCAEGYHVNSNLT